MTFTEIDHMDLGRLNEHVATLLGAEGDYTHDYALLPAVIAHGQALGYRWHFSDEPHGEHRKRGSYWEGHLMLCVGLQFLTLRNRAESLPELACRLLLKAASLAK